MSAPFIVYGQSDLIGLILGTGVTLSILNKTVKLKRKIDYRAPSTIYDLIANMPLPSALQERLLKRGIISKTG